MQVAVLSFLIYICYCGSSPSRCSVKSYTLEGFVDFTGEQICRGFFCIEREALAQVFSCWFRGIFRGAFFIEHLAPTASVTKNTGVTNKQRKITANMVDFTQPMFSFVCMTMSTRL